MKFINVSRLDSIILDNNYKADEIINDFECCPEGWDCILKNELSFDQMTESQIQAYTEELVEYAKNNC